jgi:molecular chaperone HscB
MNPFAVLGLDARFDLDPQAIERAYFEKSKELHPDRFATAPAAE